MTVTGGPETVFPAAYENVISVAASDQNNFTKISEKILWLD